MVLLTHYDRVILRIWTLYKSWKRTFTWRYQCSEFLVSVPLLCVYKTRAQWHRCTIKQSAVLMNGVPQECVPWSRYVSHDIRFCLHLVSNLRAFMFVSVENFRWNSFEMPEAVAMTQIDTNAKDRSARKKSSLGKDKIVSAKVTLLDGSSLDVNVEVSLITYFTPIWVCCLDICVYIASMYEQNRILRMPARISCSTKS